jgi:tetratricopeptide (TPR) repeat protein
MDPGREENGKTGALKGKYETEEQSARGKMPAKGQSAGPRPWLFRITAATIIPVALLILVELCLRIIGFGYPTSAIIERDIAGQQVCINNLKFGWRFFPKQIAREMYAFVFPAVKSPQTYRIFVLGGSAAMGTPEPAYGFSRILKVLLDNEYQGLKFEVINMGMPAMNSHGILEIAKDCARYEPDLFIVYLGNNEVTGPYGAGTVFAPLSPSLLSIRASIAAKSTKLGQLLEGLLSSLAAGDKRPAVWKGLRMFLDNQVRFGSPELQHVYKHFENNLTDICAVGREAGTRVIVCSVATNLKDCPPFASLHNREFTQADEIMWNKIYNRAVQLESNGRYADALAYYQSAIGIDEQFAETYFRMGRCHWAMGKYNQARDSYIKARNLDTLRFRADKRINEIIYRVADRAGQEANFVDAVEACREAGLYGMPGKEFFYEHVHFNFKGNYLLARTVLDQVEKTISQQKGIKRTFDGKVLSEEDCAARLALTGWNHLEIIRKLFDGFIKNPPFTNQAYQEERVREMTERIEALKYYTQPSGLQEGIDQYQQALKWYPYDWYLHWKYGQFLREAIGDNEAAISQLAMVIRELPHCYVYNELSVLLYKQNKIDEGIKMARLALEMKPLAAWSYYNLALGLDKKGKLRPAIKYYSKALKVDPEFSTDAYRQLAAAFRSSGQNNKAIEALRDGIKVFPESADLHCGLGVFLKEQGKTSKAANEFRVALSAQPDFHLAREALMALEGNFEQEQIQP